MDPMTQSAQISSSQGLADGQNSDAKDSKFSDSFLSSSPVSLIQSPQDKRVVLGSDKPSEGVATSLRFPSQPGSFSPGNYGGESGPPDGQPDSPIKTSPVSERIKALEALAAKKKEPDFRNDGGFTHFRERRYEKTPSEQTYSTQQKKKCNAEQESPESPFEVLGEVQQTNEFEDTADWMRAHLPPVPDFSDTVSLTKSTLASEKSDSTKEVQEPDTVIPDVPAAFAGVPDGFVDAPVESLEPKPTLDEPPNRRSVDEESEFDLSFLPTAYVWEQQNTGPQVPPTADTALPVSPAPPVPPEGSHSPSPPLSPPVIDYKLDAVDAEKTPWGGDLEPVEASEMDSSEESDDTVIEDGAVVPASSDTVDSSDPAAKPASSDLSTEEIESPPPEKPQKKLMQVPTINVIETDEPNYSEEEMELEEEEMDEDYEVVKGPTQEAPVSPEPEAEVMTAELPKARPLETEFMEGYSPPSSPVESDGEYSPKHTIFESEYETTTKVSESKMVEQNPPVLQDQSSDIPQAQREQSKTSAIDFKGKPSTFASMPSITREDVDFPDYDDEWSDETQDTAVKCDEADVISEGLIHGISSVTNLIDTDEKRVYIEKASITKSSFMHDDLYDRQSFDDYSSPPLEEMLNKNDLNLGHEHSSHDDSNIHIEKLSENTNQIDYTEDVQSMDDEDTFPKPVGGQPSPRDYPKHPYYSFQSGPQSSTMEEDNDLIGGSVANSKMFSPEETSSKIQKDAKGGTPERTSDHESTEPECSVSGSTDSFVDFMKECLKSRQGDESADSHESFSTTNELSKSGLPPPFQASPTVVVDLEHEELTISALKELGSSQDKEKPPQPSAKVSGCSNADPSAGPIHSRFDPAPHLPPPQNNPPSDSTYSKEVEAIDVWVAEAYHLAEHVLTAILTHLSVKELIHWRDPKKSGVVFGLSLLLLLSLAAFSVISVASYLLLALLCVTISFRIYKSVVQAVQKSGDGHPFKALMDKDVSIPPETFRKHVDSSLTYINRALKHMSRLFLVEDLVDSLKLAVFMWLLTYVGAVFNGITILILADILLFAVPPIYEKNKTQIDQYIDLARTHINTAVTKLQEKLPGAMKRAKTE